MTQYGFTYRSKQALSDAAALQGVMLPMAERVDALLTPLTGSGFTLENRLVMHPMEASDGEHSAPGPLTRRRYLRWAAGGAGLIWMEAAAVTPEGRANPRQLMLTQATLPIYKTLLQDMRAAAPGKPTIVLQLTHSGRYAKPQGTPEPHTAWHHPVLDPLEHVSTEHPPMTDTELAALPDAFARTAALAREAGFDGVDVKACHLYLYSQLLSATQRPAPYGGSLECRARLFLDTLAAVRRVVGPDFLVATRLNLYDGIDAGWGGDAAHMDLTEPIALVQWLAAGGMGMVNVTMGVPRSLPYINRPYASGGIAPTEHPLVGVGRMIDGARTLQQAAPQVAVIGTGYSYLRQYGPLVAEAVVQTAGASAVGFGRQSFAYPDFALDLMKYGAFDPDKVCLTCCLCSKMMVTAGNAGCPVRDRDVYIPELMRTLGR